ncbi:ribosome maturation factor RimP [Candidatus Omnitrophota bacterium]
MPTLIPEELENFIQEEVKRGDYQLVDIVSRGKASLEIVLDKEGGITLDECADFNRTVSAWIDEKEMFAGAYTLDVSSPGIDRVLKSDRDFEWAVGKDIEVKMYEPIGEVREVTGKLIETNSGENIIVEDEAGTAVSIGRNNVSRAKLKVCI